jgi:hypothetical protein
VRRANGKNGATGDSGRTIAATYDYLDGMGELRCQVVRFNTNLQRRPNGKGDWIRKAPLHRRRRGGT